MKRRACRTPRCSNPSCAGRHRSWPNQPSRRCRARKRKSDAALGGRAWRFKSARLGGGSSGGNSPAMRTPGIGCSLIRARVAPPGARRRCCSRPACPRKPGRRGGCRASWRESSDRQNLRFERRTSSCLKLAGRLVRKLSWRGRSRPLRAEGRSPTFTGDNSPSTQTVRIEQFCVCRGGSFTMELLVSDSVSDSTGRQGHLRGQARERLQR